MPDTNQTERFVEDSNAVQAHLGLLQSIIGRMAGNSASCKAWCITLSSAILVVVADKDRPDYAFIAAIPIFLFLFLDVYYLALEQRFRQTYNDFIDRLHRRQVRAQDLYVLAPSGSLWEYAADACLSPSIWPFYLGLLIMATVLKFFVLNRA